MDRRRSTPAIILRAYRIGEIHRGVVMLTPEEGLVRAIAHGALSQKGRLRGSTVPFTLGECYLYTDPVRQSVKVTDMQAACHFVGLREDIKRFYTASLWTELILKTFASGGSADLLFVLFTDALRLLDASDREEADRISIQFLWRFLDLAGSRPDLDVCACSGETLPPDVPVYYAPAETGFCAEAYSTDSMIEWSAGIAAYLRHSSSLELAAAVRVAPPVDAAPRIKRVLYMIVQDLVESPLHTLRIGSGII
jgi:DNA repair protein RecO (recombination protein O)